MAPQHLLDDSAFSAPDTTAPTEPRLVALPRRLPAFDPSAGPVVRFVKLRRPAVRFLAKWFLTPFALGALGVVILVGAGSADFWLRLVRAL